MKKLTLFYLLSICISINAQTTIQIGNNNESKGLNIIKLQAFDFSASFNTPIIKLSSEINFQGNFTKLDIEDFTALFNTGKPQLPNYNKLVEIPYGAKIKINIISYDVNEYNLASLGFIGKIYPCQPSYSKNTLPKDIHFEYDIEYYQRDSYNETPIVSIVKQGIMRGVTIGKLSIAPIQYNPIDNTIKVYSNIVFEVKFQNANIFKTNELKQKYYSPYFSASFSKLINYNRVYKDQITQYPVKYVIVSYPSFQTALQPFVKWKNRKGFKVIEYYPTSPTTASIKAFLQNLYDNASVTNPAPSFVLFVGDVAQIPAWTGTTGTHVTDLYYCEYDGGSDYIADAYYGRFSATNLTQLSPQIEKTLQYEQYLMPTTDYLDTVIMVAGVDATYAPTYANGQISYGVENYFNSTHGIFSHTYLYPQTSQSATVTDIQHKMYKPHGYANYTAHCNEAGWGDPSFTTSNVPSMQNSDHYGLIVGNCCLSNKFDVTECLGESLLRASKKGAVGYIGASNNSLWDEDYYWSVGSRSSITATPTYNANNLGAYDRMFHDHGEIANDWFVTNGQMIHAGNLGVEQSNSTSKTYYWEIYHLMGDPSVMTYFSKPDALPVSYSNPILTGTDTLHVRTLPGAYVAISCNDTLIDARLADATGLAILQFPAFVTVDTATIVATMQNKAPYIGTLNIIDMLVSNDVQTAAIINPISIYNCANLNIIPNIKIVNRGQNQVTNLTLYYSYDNNNISQIVWNGNLSTYASAYIDLPSINLTAGNHTLKVFCSMIGDGNNLNDTISKNISVNDFTIVSNFSANETQFCSAPNTVDFSNLCEYASSYSWDFGDGTNSTESNPIHTYSSLGLYSVKLIASDAICGNKTKTIIDYILIGAQPPQVTPSSHCGAGEVTLGASVAGNIYWYDNQNSTTSIDTGIVFTTPTLTQTTTYYVENRIENPLFNIGKADNTGAGQNFTSAVEHGIIFNSYNPFTIVSAKFYATGSGNRTFYLKDSLNNNISTFTINIPDGENRVALNLSIPRGNSLKLVAQQQPNLYRNGSTNGANLYPFTVNAIMNIFKSTATNTNTYKYYYFFYDLEIKEPDCISSRIPVNAIISDVSAVPEFTETYDNLDVHFINNSLNASSFVWDFGDGSPTVNSENPIHTYSAYGTYIVTLSATNACGSNQTTQNIVVVDFTGISQYSGNAHINIYPNPIQDKVIIDSDIAISRISVSDALGNTIITKISNKQKEILSLRNLKSGIYFIKIFIGDKSQVYKVVKVWQ